MARLHPDFPYLTCDHSLSCECRQMTWYLSWGVCWRKLPATRGYVQCHARHTTLCTPAHSPSRPLQVLAPWCALLPRASPPFYSRRSLRCIHWQLLQNERFAVQMFEECVHAWDKEGSYIVESAESQLFGRTETSRLHCRDAPMRRRWHLPRL